MDLNQLLSHHQRAQIASHSSSSDEQQRWARTCAAYYADRIVRTRSALGRDDPFTWTQPVGGIACHG